MQAIAHRASGVASERPSELELATDWVIGSRAGVELPEIEDMHDPVEALADAIRPALVQGPCLVAFSGGRDSSVVLAVATQLARREGHPLPIPVTLKARAYAPSEEGEWQRLVLDHLGIREREEVEIGSSMGALGPIAVELLERFGVQIDQPRFITACAQVSEGGSLLTGYDGDEVFDPAGWGGVSEALAGVRRPRASDLKGLLRSGSPYALRRRLYRRSLLRSGAQRYSWLRPDAQDCLIWALADDWSEAPLRFDRQVEWYARRRELWGHLETMRAVGAASGVEVVCPLADLRFLAALAEGGGPRGFGGRTEALVTLFGGLLPERLLRRADKGEYGGPYWGPEVAEFARSWDGSGVPKEIVIVEELRRLWLSGQPLIATQPLLHAAWLESDRSRP